MGNTSSSGSALSIVGSRRGLNILIIGLDASGKTALFNRVLADNATIIDQLSESLLKKKEQNCEDGSINGPSPNSMPNSPNNYMYTRRSATDDSQERTVSPLRANTTTSVYSTSNTCGDFSSPPTSRQPSKNYTASPSGSPSSLSSSRRARLAFPVEHSPTCFSRVETSRIVGRTVTFCEVGGLRELRASVWPRYASCGVDGIVFVVDGRDRSRLFESREALVAVLTSEAFCASGCSAHVPIAVFVNKTGEGGGGDDESPRPTSAANNTNTATGMELSTEEVARVMDLERGLRGVSYKNATFHQNGDKRLGFPSSAADSSKPEKIRTKKKKLKKEEIEGFGNPEHDSPSYDSTSAPYEVNNTIRDTNGLVSSTNGTNGAFAVTPSIVARPSSFVTGGSVSLFEDQSEELCGLEALTKRQIEYFAGSAKTGQGVSSCIKWVCRAAKQVEAAVLSQAKAIAEQARMAEQAKKKLVADEKRRQKDLERAKKNQKAVKF